MRKAVVSTLVVGSVLVHATPSVAQILLSVPLLQNGVDGDPMALNYVLAKLLANANARVDSRAPKTLEPLKACGQEIRCLLAVGDKAKERWPQKFEQRDKWAFDLI